MLRKFRRKKRAQIQGVDFALAMIIFMIMFAEIIVLSLSFIQPKFQNIDNQIFQSQAEQITETFFESSGYPSYWEYNYTTKFNAFGLKEVGTTNIDPNKLSRLNPKGLYAISYENLRGNLSQEQDYSFQLTVDSTFSVNSSLSLTPPTGTINIQTELGNCLIWEFVVDSSGSVLFTNRTRTNSLGVLTETFSVSGPLSSGFYSLVVFAKSPSNHFAVDVKQVIVGSDNSDLGLKLLVQEDENNNGKAIVTTENDGTLNVLSAIILYPYADGSESYGNDSNVITSPTSSETFNLRMPTNGSSVVLLTGTTATGEYARSFFVFPTTLTTKTNTVFGEYFLPEKEDLIRVEKIVVIRECIFKAVLYIWSD